MAVKPCVFPDANEQQWQTIACADGTALRVWVQAGMEGYVRVQQLAHTDGLGWYVQKTFVIPGEALRLLVPQLRQAACVIQAKGEATLQVPEGLRLVDHEGARVERVGA